MGWGFSLLLLLLHTFKNIIWRNFDETSSPGAKKLVWQEVSLRFLRPCYSSQYVGEEASGYSSRYVGEEPFKIFAVKPQTLLIFQALLVCVPSFLPSLLPTAMDSPTAFYSNFSPSFSFFVYAHLILLLVFLLCSRSLLLIRLKPFLGFFLSFFHPTHQNIQATLVIEEFRNQELFGSIHTYITYKLLPSSGGGSTSSGGMMPVLDE